MAIIDFIRNHKRLVFIIFAFCFFGLFLILIFGKGKAPVQISSGLASWNGLVPNKSTKDQVTAELGQSTFETRNGTTTVDNYKSTSPTREHQVTYNNQTATFFKQIVSINDKETITDLQAKYGQPDFKLYGPDSSNGYFLFVYLSKGVAYLGNPISDNLLEIWYFPPTDSSGFVKNYASNYSTKPQNTY